MTKELVINVLAGLIVLVVVRCRKVIKISITKTLQLLYGYLSTVIYKLKRSFPYYIDIHNKNKIRDYVFIQAKHDGIVLDCDIGTKFTPLKSGDIRKIKYEYYKDINNFDEGFKRLNYNDVLCVSYTDEYINKYIKEHHKRVKDQKTIEALYHNMSNRVYYILKSEFDSYKYKKVF